MRREGCILETSWRGVLSRYRIERERSGATDTDVIRTMEGLEEGSAELPLI